MMDSVYPMVPLGEILTKSEEWIDLIPDEVYREVTVRLWGKGVVQRREVPGAEIGATRRLVVRARQFILSRIDARHGALGLIPEALDGAVVSNDFPVFTPNASKLLPSFLAWISKTNTFVDICRAASEGTTNRVRLDEQRFLTFEIPLPSLNEQRRIVARIEALAAQIEEARGLRRGAVEEGNNLLESAIDDVLLNTDAKHVTVEAVATTVTDGDHSSPPKSETGDVPFIFISNLIDGKIIFKNCKYVTQEYFNSIHSTRIPKLGDVLYTAVGATYGKPYLVTVDTPFCFQRHIAIIKPDRRIVSSEYLAWALSSRTVYEQATKFITGTAQPTVPLHGIRRLQFPLPPIEE
jgi:type I restriction enzyme S subunit